MREKMEFVYDDLVLSILKLKSPCKISININEEYIWLNVGPRDWQWDINTGKFIGSGTMLGE